MKDTRPTGPASRHELREGARSDDGEGHLCPGSQSQWVSALPEHRWGSPRLINSRAVNPNLVLAYDPLPTTGHPQELAARGLPASREVHRPRGPCPAEHRSVRWAADDLHRSRAAARKRATPTRWWRPIPTPVRTGPAAARPATVTMPPGLPPAGLRPRLRWARRSRCTGSLRPMRPATPCSATTTPITSSAASRHVVCGPGAGARLVYLFRHLLLQR